MLLKVMFQLLATGKMSYFMIYLILVEPFKVYSCKR